LSQLARDIISSTLHWQRKWNFTLFILRRIINLARFTKPNPMLKPTNQNIT